MIRLLFPLLLLMYSSAVPARPACPAHFGHQELLKKHQGALGRRLVMRCAVKNWKNRLCGGRQRVTWYLNSTTLLSRKKYYPGVKVGRLRLNIAMLTALHVGDYSCALPNGRTRTFKVTARSTDSPNQRRHLLPMDPTEERRDHFYWLPAILDQRQMFVASEHDENYQPFKCLFYIASSNTSSAWTPPLTWTFSQIVYKKWVTIVDNYEVGNKLKKVIPPRPHVRIRTREVNCRKQLLQIAWRSETPRGRCFESALLFRHFKDEETGDYSCVIGAHGKQQLRMNFTVQLHIKTGTWIETPNTKKKGMTGGGGPTLAFNMDRRACAGENVTLHCRVRPAHLTSKLAIYRLIPNASEPTNFTLQLMTATKSEPAIYLTDNSSSKTKRHRVVMLENDYLTHNLSNVSAADSGIYQCNTDKAWAPTQFVMRNMTLDVRNCYRGRILEIPDHHNAMVLTVVLPVFLIFLVFAIVCGFCCWRRQMKKTERRRVVVVHPSANTAYPAFLRRRHSDFTETDITSSCLTPASSTLGSATALLTPLRPPEVHVQTRHRFTRRSGSASTRWIRSRSAQMVYELPDQAGWELDRHRLNVGADIGEGAFGVVRRGLLGGIEVAVKMLKVDFTEEELMDLVKEMEVMKLLDPHPNIIRLLGVCTRDGPLCIVNEYAPYGNLRDFLRARRPGLPERTALARGLLTYRHLIDFSLDAVAGLEYLSARSVVHRDIAARNVLVGPKFEAKIADFGLSRHVVNYYRKTTEGRLPVKWLAPEALFDHMFTREGDVWSFGILLWEIFSLGGSPYPSIPVERLFVLLNQGYRNEPPFYAFPQVYALMRRCWAQEPMNRPRFSELRQQLESLRGVEEYAQLLREAPPTGDNGHYLSMEA